MPDYLRLRVWVNKTETSNLYALNYEAKKYRNQDYSWKDYKILFVESNNKA